MTWNRVPKDKKDPYLDICNQAFTNDEIFKSFKTNTAYQKILEHSNISIAEMWLNLIRKDNPWLLDLMPKFATSDTVGGGEKQTIQSYEISPSTVRYVGILNELINKFGSLDNFNIIEIGGGYGGQYKIIADCFTLSSYAIVDLQEPLDLATKYCKAFNLSFDAILPEQTEGFRDQYDLVISCYAITELDNKEQEQYIKRILSKSSRGWLECNELSSYKRGDRIPNPEAEKRPNQFIQWWA